MPSIEIRYYSRLRELTGSSSEKLQVDGGSTVGDAVTRVVCRHPLLVPLRTSLLLAKNEEYTSPDEVLKEGDRLDLMPPVSGG